jgi:hypothetical protein
MGPEVAATTDICLEMPHTNLRWVTGAGRKLPRSVFSETTNGIGDMNGSGLMDGIGIGESAFWLVNAS